MHKKVARGPVGGGGGVRVVVNEELKLMRKCKKKLGVRSGEGGRLVRMVVYRELKLLWKHVK